MKINTKDAKNLILIQEKDGLILTWVGVPTEYLPAVVTSLEKIKIELLEEYKTTKVGL